MIGRAPAAIRTSSGAARIPSRRPQNAATAIGAQATWIARGRGGVSCRGARPKLSDALAGPRQVDLQCGAEPGLGVAHQKSGALLHDAIRSRQTQTGSLAGLFRRKKPFEDSR